MRTDAWCSPKDVTFTERKAFSEGRPVRPLYCRGCGNAVPTHKPYWYCCVECPPICEDCWRRVAAELWIEHRRGIPRRYHGSRWEDFAFDRGGESNRDKVRAVREYAEGFPVEGLPYGYPSLVLASPSNGVGKTLLACLMLETIYRRMDPTRGVVLPAQFWPVHDIRLRLSSVGRHTFDETWEQVMGDFATMPLLVIDDVGKERLGGEANYYETYSLVLEARYNANLPVVLTTNLGLEPWTEGGPSLVDLLGRATVSRLAEMAGGKIYVIEGEDRR